MKTGRPRSSAILPKQEMLVRPDRHADGVDVGAAYELLRITRQVRDAELPPAEVRRLP